MTISIRFQPAFSGFIKLETPPSRKPVQTNESVTVNLGAEGWYEFNNEGNQDARKLYPLRSEAMQLPNTARTIIAGGTASSAPVTTLASAYIAKETPSFTVRDKSSRRRRTCGRPPKSSTQS